MEQKIVMGIVAVLIVAAIGIFFIAPQSATNGTTVPAGKYTAFAQCLVDSGTTFFGAFWCPHCNAQKALFGDAAKDLPYVECSTPDQQNQLPICIEAGVTAYPTWEFPDGSRLTGEVPLATLAQKTGCELPLEGGEVEIVDVEEGASSDAQ